MSLFWKAPMSKAERLTNGTWDWYFRGVTFGQRGFGFVWRERRSTPGGAP